MASKFPHQPQVKPEYFYKIILTHSLQEGKLVIPSKFAVKYGEGLPKTIFLKPPNGTEWELNLVKHDGEIWFEKGWKEFAGYHSLAQGHLLVFRYERTSHFLVHIFDVSALEINYPFKREEVKGASNYQGNKPPMVEKRKDNLSLELLQPCKMRSTRCIRVNSTLKFPKPALHHAHRKCKEEPMAIAKQVTALDRANSFKPCNPSFQIVMHPSYINSRGRPNLPSKFCKRHFDLNKTRGDINLQVSNGRVWPVSYLIRKINTTTKVEISSGWKQFANGNNLKVGDVCTFELIPRTKLTFQVYIFRETYNSDCPTSHESAQMRAACQGQIKKMKIITTTKSSSPPMVRSLKDYRPSQKRKDNSLSQEFLQQINKKSRCVEVESISSLSEEALHHTGKKCKEEPKTSAKQITALDRATSFKPLNPSCVVVMHPSYLHSKSNLNLPAKFGNRYFDLGINQGDINLRLAIGKVWPARYLIRETYTGTRFELSSGWKPFAKDNKLKVGDVCTFEFIDRTKLTFQVYIFRQTDNSNCSASQEKPMIAAQQITALDRANSSKPCNPSFLVVMQPSYVRSHAHLNLPSEFCKKHFDSGEKRGDINLQLSNGRVWPTMYHIMKFDTRTKFHLTKRWEAFAKENDLKVGDVCTFELIDRTKLTFQVYIFRETENSNCVTSQGSDDAPRNHEPPIQVYSRKEKKNKSRLMNELGNRVEESVMQDSNRMDTLQQQIGEDNAGIMERNVNMKGMESGVRCV